MSKAKTVISYYLHVLLYIILTLLQCYSSDNSEIELNLHRTNKNDKMNSGNHGNVHDLETSPNNSLNESDFKVSAPVWRKTVNFTTVMEGFTIFGGLSIAIVLYFTIKAIRLRRRRCRVRKYGLLTSREDVEMTPLGEEEDDEDSTVFDINDHPRSMSRP